MKARRLSIAAIAPVFTIVLIGSVMAAGAAEESVGDPRAVNSYIRSRLLAFDAGNPVLPAPSEDDCDVVDDHEVARPADGSRKRNTVCNTGTNEASGGASLVLDGGFEQGRPNPFWGEISLSDYPLLCTVANCGDGGGTGPHSGNWWAWFGGVNGTAEYGLVYQDIMIPAGSSTLSFLAGDPGDRGYGIRLPRRLG